MTVTIEAPTPIPPGPKGHFLTGSLHDFRQGALSFLTQCVREYGDIVRIRLGPFSFYLLGHPDYIEQVLVTPNSNFVKGRLSKLFTRILGNGLASSEGSFWQRQRRLMQPAFHRERIAAYANVMVDYTQQMLNRWQDGTILDVHQEMMELTLQIVAKTLFSTEVASVAHEVTSAFTVGMRHLSARIASKFILPDWIPTPSNLRYQRAVRQLDNTIYSIIHQRRKSGETTGDLLDMLLRLQDEDGNSMTDQQIRDEVMTLFFAGHETTAVTLSWTCYLLSQHSEVEAKLIKELQTVLGQRVPTFTDLPQLQYTEKIIKESMRLYPPAWLLNREVSRECELGGYKLSAGATIFISPWILQHDPRFFEQPETFNPSRWTDELAKQLPAYSYIPFGAGPRICIGKSFAIMEAVLILAAIAQKFRLSLVPGHPIIPLPIFVLRPKDGIKMLLNQR